MIMSMSNKKLYQQIRTYEMQNFKHEKTVSEEQIEEMKTQFEQSKIYQEQEILNIEDIEIVRKKKEILNLEGIEILKKQEHNA